MKFIMNLGEMRYRGGDVFLILFPLMLNFSHSFCLFHRFAVCFVSGLYSLVMAVLPVFALLRQCWLVSLGITGSEWRTMPLSHILRLGVTAHRPHSRGLVMNWYYLLTCRDMYK